MPDVFWFSRSLSFIMFGLCSTSLPKLSLNLIPFSTYLNMCPFSFFKIKILQDQFVLFKCSNMCDLILESDWPTRGQLPEKTVSPSPRSQQLLSMELYNQLWDVVCLGIIRLCVYCFNCSELVCAGIQVCPEGMSCCHHSFYQTYISF